MSIENAKSFYERVSTDKQFRTQLENTASAEERQKIIQAAGFEFTNQEWEIAKEQILATSESNNGELSEAELTAVSGGVDLSIFELLDEEPLFPIRPLYGLPI
ncbi:Nif11-like leader peptide family RiPP precursor [Pleurocapsa sp. PCC 7319]|uniref:Nif11-like leader peptide family RiPP precursor n=1 Tax=Pleurocapsa sp. PCC 7319 TaxID=118161 RepID=UPI0003475AD8|nr:Nif11-like leader peptide family RiPP precursor [Pleurocapsa sp. PCC 7319]